MKNILNSSLALLITASILQAQTIAQWTFESSGPSISGTAASFTGIAPEVGTGTGSGVHASALSVWSSPAGNGSVESFSVNNWAANDYFEFQTSTLGYAGIMVSFDQTSSSTGPGDFSLQYSTDGVAYTLFANYDVLANANPPGFWSSSTPHPEYAHSFDLSAISALDNAAAVYFRLVDMSSLTPSGGTVAATGADRIDNFTVAVVPEPSTAALVGLGLFALSMIRRRG